jgi:hypothetical protein
MLWNITQDCGLLYYIEFCYFVLMYLTKWTFWRCWYLIGTHTDDDANWKDTNHPTNSISPYGVLIVSVFYRCIFNPIEEEDELKEKLILMLVVNILVCEVLMLDTGDSVTGSNATEVFIHFMNHTSYILK